MRRLSLFSFIFSMVFLFQNCQKLKPVSQIDTSSVSGLQEDFSTLNFTGFGQTIECSVYNSVQIKGGSDYNVKCRYSGPPLSTVGPTLSYQIYTLSGQYKVCPYAVTASSVDIWKVGFLDQSWNKFLGGANDPYTYFLFPSGPHNLNAVVLADIEITVDPNPTGEENYIECSSVESEQVSVVVPQMDVQCPWGAGSILCPGGNPTTTTSTTSTSTSTSSTVTVTTQTTSTTLSTSSFESEFCISFLNTNGKHRTKCANTNSPEIGISIDRSESAEMWTEVSGNGSFSCLYRDKNGASGSCDIGTQYTFDPSIYPENYWIEVTISKSGSSSTQTRRISF
ncbi:MAG: hypothetical protein KDD25_01025 [Bdellovibrionales bacterium]|nr:hypothetical protein [Bdellovibrionales bacterium]